MNSVFMFGGSWMNINAIKESSSSNECLENNCYIFSSEIEELIDPLQSDNMFLILIWSMTFLFVVIGFAFWIRYCCYSRNRNESFSNNSKEGMFVSNEKGVLIRNDGNLWGADAFSADLDEEELEWGDEAFTMDVELKEIT